MPRPAFVRDLGEYFRWVEDVIEQMGGHLVEPDGYLEPYLLPMGAGARMSGVLIDFWDGCQVAVGLILDSELNLKKYHFRYLVDGEAVCRLDHHPGHEHEHGTQSHVHWWPETDAEYREPTDRFEFDDALRYIRDLDAQRDAAFSDS